MVGNYFRYGNNYFDCEKSIDMVMVYRWRPSIVEFMSFILFSPGFYAELLNDLEDATLHELVLQRQNEKLVEVDLSADLQPVRLQK